MLQENEFNELISRYISGEITSSEKLKLREMLDGQEGLEALDPILRDNFAKAENNFASEKQTQQFLDTLNSKITASESASSAKEVKLFNWKNWVAAASLLIAVGVGATYVVNRELPTEPQTVTVVPQIKEISPAVSGAILILSDGSEIVLDSLGNTQIAQQSNTTISNKSGQLVYKSNKGSSTVYNTLSTPKAQKYSLQLADGTKVWLNASSSIKFPTAFSGGTRQVSITGEAYFEVSPDKKRPFIVDVKGMQIEVLGTHFNVNSYSDEEVIRTTLLEGSVVINQNRKSKKLYPGQQATVNSIGDITLEKNVNLSQIMSWKNGLFYFENSSLQEVMRELSRWYDVEVVYVNGIPDRNFEGEIQRNLKLSEVLRILELNKVKFKVEGRTVLISN
ncbi:MAG: FecR family protein [Flavobacterium sp.]